MGRLYSSIRTGRENSSSYLTVVDAGCGRGKLHAFADALKWASASLV